ncbi:MULTISPECIES: hypothetical protein [Desulfitobacterium]|uniref:Uncharacterized protein n=1 Tax=Desulfitobacterium dehalogenans (strain ATCC 51507 / DSM 9161 / JW/IU-DC1) TaxID=756499 RepID=I4ACP6_DESDJ|nr:MULTISPECIES: hypothetical protein [Desulfitobacterium]AFM01731.1 hypothetical protein Desde_3449 [Desulfitobacterium dehalogenans ATCC 51507]
MWPKRKILLLVPQNRDGWQGILSLLNVLHRDVIVRETSPEAIVDWADRTIPGLEEELYDVSDVGPTEIFYWPGIPQEDPYRQWGLSRGLIQTELTEFLHRYWEEEIVLPVNPKLGDNEPFLWRILDCAGFEPSLLWQTKEGQWEARINNGLHWIIPESWFTECWGHEMFGRRPKLVLAESCWVRQGDQVEFYSDKDRFEYLGEITPCADKALDDAVYTVMLQALQLGVPWRSIRRAYDMMNIRWYTNDMARDEWTGRAPVPSEEIEYLADRGVG